VDVLHLIKEEHEGIRGLLNDLHTARSATVRKKVLEELKRKVQMHIHLEGEYLYPEVAGLFNESSTFIEKSTENHKMIHRSLSEVEKLLNKKPQVDNDLINKKMLKLVESFKDHFESEEDILMPKLRELIPTQDREDLGQVFLDVRDEQVLAVVGGRSAPSRRRH